MKIVVMGVAWCGGLYCYSFIENCEDAYADKEHQASRDITLCLRLGART